MITPAPAPMLPSWGQTAHHGLHCLHVMSLLIPHLTLQGVWPLTHRGHPWSKCHRWCPQLPCQHLAWTQLRSTSPSLSWITCKLEAHVWALHECVGTVARDAGDGGWRHLYYSQFIFIFCDKILAIV